MSTISASLQDVGRRRIHQIQIARAYEGRRQPAGGQDRQRRVGLVVGAVVEQLAVEGDVGSIEPETILTMGRWAVPFWAASKVGSRDTAISSSPGFR